MERTEWNQDEILYYQMQEAASESYHALMQSEWDYYDDK